MKLRKLRETYSRRGNFVARCLGFSGYLLQTAQTWATAGVCSASCAHALGIMFVCLFICLFELVCLFVCLFV